MLNILIADDHAVVRRGLKQILSETPDLLPVGEAANGDELLEKLKASKWDVVTLDISMPGKSGLELLKELRQLHPSLPVLVLSVQPEGQFAVRALRAGAAGYINKETAPEEMVAAIRKVSRGGKYVSPALAELLAFKLESSEFPLHSKLSNREYEVLVLLAGGNPVKAIGEKLGLSVKTVSTYRTRILAKMNLRNNSELMRYAISEGLVT